MTDQPTSSTSNSSHAWLLVRKIFLPLAAFIVVVSLCTDFVFTKVLTQYAELSNSYKLARLEDKEKLNNEIPIFGPSISRNAYYCDSLGANYYNYSMENAGFIITQLMMTLEVDKEKNTPIIIDFNFRLMEMDTQGSSINISTYLPFVKKDERVNNFLKENGRYRPHQSIPGGRYFGVYSSYVKDYLAEVYQPRKLYHRGGVFNRQAPPAELMARYISDRRGIGLKPFIYDPELEAGYEAIIEAHPERLFFFIGSPRHYSILEMMPNYDEMKAWGKKMQDKHYNVRVIIFEDDYPDEYFKDTGHLSLLGARTFSGQMRRTLQDLGLYFTGDEAQPVWPAKPDDIAVVKLSAP